MSKPLTYSETLSYKLNGREFEQTPGDCKRTEKLGMLQSMGSQRVGPDLVTKQQQ